MKKWFRDWLWKHNDGGLPWSVEHKNVVLEALEERERQWRKHVGSLCDTLDYCYPDFRKELLEGPQP